MTGAPSGEWIRSVFAAIRSAPIPLKHALDAVSTAPRPFVTISRAGGAGGRTLGQCLVNRLNELDPAEIPWTLWDRQIVEKVSADSNIAAEVVEALGTSGQTWMQDFLAGLNFQGDETEARVYQRVAATIRLLAQRGRTVIVGRGGVYITRNMPGGVHLRLVAPLEYRIKAMAQQMNLDDRAAETYVRQLDRHRQAFYNRYWPREVLNEEMFTLTINTARTPEKCAVEGVLPFVLKDMRAVRGSRITERVAGA